MHWMNLSEKIKQSYENGKIARFLLRKKDAYVFMIINPPKGIVPGRPIYQDLREELRMIHIEEAKIPMPKSFLEELSYNFGKDPKRFLSLF